jgi:hypothetical protein
VALVGLKSRRTIQTTQIEAANYLKCFVFCLHNEQYAMAAALFRLLWEVAREESTPALSIDQLTPWRNEIIELAAKLCTRTSISGSERADLILDAMDISIRVARFYMLKAPREAAKCAKYGLDQVMKFLKDPADWSEKTGDLVQTLLLLRACAFLLIDGGFEDAAFAALLA